METALAQQAMAQQPIVGAALWAAIQAARRDLPAKMRLIAAFVIDSPTDFIRMTAREICARLGTSEPTLIRFCRGFGYTGLADFRIELALALADQGSGIAPLAADRRLANQAAKRAIARATVPLLMQDRAVLIDNGSTAEMLAEQLGDDRLGPMAVMTSGLTVAQNAMRCARHRVMLTGGLIRPETASMTGRLVETSLAGMAFDSFVMGADSIDPEVGLSTYAEDEAHITRAMIGAAARVLVVADHTKFRRARLHRICGLGRIAALVTDRAPGAEMTAALEAAGVRLVIADPIPTGATP